MKYCERGGLKKTNTLHYWHISLTPYLTHLFDCWTHINPGSMMTALTVNNPPLTGIKQGGPFWMETLLWRPL